MNYNNLLKTFVKKFANIILGDRKMKYLIIVLVILFIIAIYFFNSFIKYENKVKEAFATLDVYLKKRWELIPNLVNTIKGYAFYEKTTFESIIKARSKNYDSLSNREKEKHDNEVEDAVSTLLAIKESYPELKANESFQKLMKELVLIEDELVNARKYYNATVRILNNKLMVFPNNLFAKIFKFKTYPMFSAEKEEKTNVEVSL